MGMRGDDIVAVSEERSIRETRRADLLGAWGCVRALLKI